MKRLALGAFGIVSLGICLAAAVQGAKLYMNGSVASSGVIERNGIAYVPLKDVAAALNATLVKTDRGYELSKSGGANQVEGLNGKVGDVLFNGFARFQVVKVTRGKTYQTVFDGSSRDLAAGAEGDELVVVQCQLKNGMEKTLMPSLVGGAADALTDTDGHSYEPRRTSDLPANRDLLPGAKVDFALIFEVPSSAKLQDLVYEAQFIGTTGPEKRKFRVAVGG